ncbi:MAG: DnaD domain protein [Oscillospiraceae bacterium]|nr:DnaD domain protein [Oscillospiraceae bacterium]
MYLDAHTLENLIRHTYNLRKPFSEKTLNYIKKWCDDDIPIETISDAFVACVKNTNRINFTYVDKAIEYITEKENERRESKCPKATLKETFLKTDCETKIS